MLYEETVEKGVLDLIRKLNADSKLEDFNLVGGTALALRIGHRKSIDIDLFTTQGFDSRKIADYLIANYEARNVVTVNNGVTSLINKVKVDVLAHRYPLLKAAPTIEGVRFVSLHDIGAMKLNAVYNNGSRLKDFIDMYALLEKFPLNELLAAAAKKYPDMNGTMVSSALLYHKDIDFTVPVGFINRDIKWNEIEQRLKEAVQNPQKTFDKQMNQKPLALKKNYSKSERKNKGPRL